MFEKSNLVNVSEEDDTLKIVSLNTAAKHNTWNTLGWIFNMLPVLIACYFVGMIILPYSPEAWQSKFIPVLLTLSIPWCFLLISSVSGLFYREEFILNMAEKLFLHNGVTVGSLSIIKSATIQVSTGIFGNHIFRLVLNLQNGPPVIIANSPYVPNCLRYLKESLFQMRPAYYNPERVSPYGSWTNYEGKIDTDSMLYELWCLEEKLNRELNTIYSEKLDRAIYGKREWLD